MLGSTCIYQTVYVSKITSKSHNGGGNVKILQYICVLLWVSLHIVTKYLKH